MQAVLYVGHGSRVQAGIDEAVHFIEKSKARIAVPIQELCFLELAQPSILEGIAKCVERGATAIAVIPILLLTAVHAKEDIPNEIAKGRLQYPQVDMTYGNVFGIHPKIIDSLLERVMEQNVKLTSEASVLLVGRGSSDPAVKQDLAHIATLLQVKYPFRTVDVCFLYGAEPSFAEALAQLETRLAKQVFIIPYLLFTGILMKGIENRIAQLGNQFILCESLGYHPNMQDVLVERVNDVLEIETNRQVCANGVLSYDVKTAT